METGSFSADAVDPWRPCRGHRLVDLQTNVPPSHCHTIRLPVGEGQQFLGTGSNMVALSPDGTQIVYVANRRLYLRRMGELEAKAIPGSESTVAVRNPVFSPDSGSIAFLSSDDQMLKRIAINGGGHDPPMPCTPPVWHELERRRNPVRTVSGGIMRVSANGGKPEPLVTVKSDEVASAPQMLPGGS